MRTKYYLIMMVAVAGWLVGTILWAFFFAFQTVGDVLNIYLNPKKAKKSLLLRVVIMVVSLKVVLTDSIPDAWRIIAGIVFVIGYSSGLMVALMANYIKMVRLAKELSQSSYFIERTSGLPTTGARQLVLYQHEMGTPLQQVKSGDLINVTMVVESLLREGLPGQLDYSSSYQKSLVAMAMMITGVSEITVLDYSEDFSIMSMNEENVRTKIRSSYLYLLAKRMGYVVVRHRKTRVRPDRQQSQMIIRLLVNYINRQWADLPVKKLLAKSFRSRRDSFFIHYFSRVVSLQGDQPRSMLGNEPRKDAERFINCSDLTTVEQAFEESGAQAVLPSMVHDRQKLFLAAVIKTGKSCFISNLIGYRGFMGHWQTTEIRSQWKVFCPAILAILSGYRPVKTMRSKKEVSHNEESKKENS